MAAALLPDPAAVGSTADIYAWLEGLVGRVWVDPTCGDGVCETPFEFASYGRFGCRADCGRLQDIQNLTAVQIDLYYDFTHPAGSIPATVRKLAAAGRRVRPAAPCICSCRAAP